MPWTRRRAQAVAVLEQLLPAMDVPATLETKDLPDGSISIAVMPAVELAGVASGRRSPLGDALQYLVNKLVNKPGQERRWVAIGLGGHPEPRGQNRAATPPGRAAGGGDQRARARRRSRVLRRHRVPRRRPGLRTSTSAPWSRTRTRHSRPPCVPWRSGRRARARLRGGDARGPASAGAC